MIQAMFAKYDEIFSRYYEIFDKQHEELNNIGYELVRLSEDTKVLKK